MSARMTLLLLCLVKAASSAEPEGPAPPETPAAAITAPNCLQKAKELKDECEADRQTHRWAPMERQYQLLVCSKLVSCAAALTAEPEDEFKCSDLVFECANKKAAHAKCPDRVGVMIAQCNNDIDEDDENKRKEFCGKMNECVSEPSVKLAQSDTCFRSFLTCAEKKGFSCLSHVDEVQAGCYASAAELKSFGDAKQRYDAFDRCAFINKKKCIENDKVSNAPDRAKCEIALIECAQNRSVIQPCNTRHSSMKEECNNAERYIGNGSKFDANQICDFMDACKKEPEVMSASNANCLKSYEDCALRKLKGCQISKSKMIDQCRLKATGTSVDAATRRLRCKKMAECAIDKKKGEKCRSVMEKCADEKVAAATCADQWEVMNRRCVKYMLSTWQRKTERNCKKATKRCPSKTPTPAYQGREKCFDYYMDCAQKNVKKVPTGEPKPASPSGPEPKPENQPENKPEQQPDKQPEKKPEKQPEEKPDEKPEKQPEEKPEKQPEPPAPAKDADAPAKDADKPKATGK